MDKLLDNKLKTYIFYRNVFVYNALITYLLVYYYTYLLLQGKDFASFYYSTQMLIIGGNPYQVLLSTYLPKIQRIAANLNPPILLLFFNPLVKFYYAKALCIWSIISLIFGIIGTYLTFLAFFSKDFIKKTWINLYLFYFAFFATIMNIAIGQIGNLLLFLIMAGYHLYIRHKDISAGILWGLVIAIKFFPGLLFFFVLIHKRYKVLWSMLIVCILLSLFPIMLFGIKIYQNYFNMLFRVLWYGDNWNASLYGLLFRITQQAPQTNPLWLKISYAGLFCMLLVWYLKKIKFCFNHDTITGNFNYDKTNENIQGPFALTLCMMLFMSPFGWLYYFSLLFFPLIYTWLAIFSHTKPVRDKCLWYISLFLLNTPMDYVGHMKMTILKRVSNYSCYCYGLLLLIILVNKYSIHKAKQEINYSAEGLMFLAILYALVGFSLLDPMITYALNFLSLIFNSTW